MKIIFEKRVFKDFDKIDEDTLFKINEIITKISTLDSFQDLTHYFNVKRLIHNWKFFRLRVGNYRLWFTLEWEGIKIIRCLHRKDIYKVFL